LLTAPRTEPLAVALHREGRLTRLAHLSDGSLSPFIQLDLLLGFLGFSLTLKAVGVIRILQLADMFNVGPENEISVQQFTVSVISQRGPFL